jgi:molybdenum cofactor cytidylyltransferase
VTAVALVLAAGASSRFGSNKLLAPLDGRPVLQHALDAVAAAGIADVVVVLGSDVDALEAAIAWRGERRVVNERPEDGISSSIRAGLDAAVEVPGADSALVVLGDQPALRPGVIRAVLTVAESPGAAAAFFVRPRYAEDPAPNPVLVRRTAWALAAGLEGDWGLGQLMANQPDRVVEVPVAGANPDVDTPADLAAVAAAPPEDLR